jgi:hypothetical protein
MDDGRWPTLKDTVVSTAMEAALVASGIWCSGLALRTVGALGGFEPKRRMGAQLGAWKRKKGAWRLARRAAGGGRRCRAGARRGGSGQGKIVEEENC